MSRSCLSPHMALVALICAFMFSSCRTPKDVVYFQDIESRTSLPIGAKPLAIRPFDELSIIVTARDPQVSDMLNQPLISRQLGLSSQQVEGYRGNVQGVVLYAVDEAGDIDFPFLGTLHVEGLTRSECANLIKQKLNQADLAKDAVVSVTIASAQVSVLGEVAKPGRYLIDSDNATLLDMLGAAGDLTIYGERSNVKVIRKFADREETYIVNLLSAKDLMASPAFYVQQDDVIYVEPNATRIRQSELNANTVLTPTFWISIASVLLTVVALIVR